MERADAMHWIPRPLTLALGLLALLGLLAGLPAAAQIPAERPLEPPGTGGVAALDRALAKLSTHRRLLVIAAHPDDEDTSLLALVARGLGGEAAYLSLSRGEGGQNLIGPELGVGLGLLRSRELLAARQVDGARQFFSRAYDFGYTRSLEETFELWPREVLLEDAVRVIRRFRPQVVVSVFPGVPIPTHGQHQAAGVTAHEAFRRAGDPEAFPGTDRPPWQPLALFRNTWFDPESTTLEIETGVLDPISGKSIFQLAMASRSHHRSQDMGVLQPLGPRASRLGWEQGGAGVEGKDLFAGVDTRLAAMAATLPEGEPRRRVEAALGEAEAAARSAREHLVASAPARTAPALVEILGRLRQAREELGADVWGAARREAEAVASLVGEKIRVAEEALATALGVAADAVADRETLVAGEELVVEALVWNGAGRPVTLEGVELESTGGWAVRPADPEPDDGGRRFFGTQPTQEETGEMAPAALYRGRFAVRVPASEEPTAPYFLRRPPLGSLYDWSGVPEALRGQPFAPPLLSARFRLTLAGTTVELEREVVWRHRDQAVGEVRRPLRVVPALEVAPARDLLVWPTRETGPRALEVSLTSHLDDPVAGTVTVTPPPGWPPVAPVPFQMTANGSSEAVRVELTPPRPFEPGHAEAQVAAVLDDGRSFALAVPVVDYPHIRPTPWPRPAAVEIRAADIRVPELSRVGYLRGASDRVPEMLAEIGVPLEILTPEELLEGDLDRYPVIVLGSRAYETEPALARANPRLLDWVRRGGLLIVQYQQYDFARGGYAPYPLDISRPHDRITDETAPVTLLVPEHPVFHQPNEIRAEDWDGWVQERGLYFAGTWDAAYTPLLSMADPGGEPAQGGLLVAPVGEGTWVYTGLAFFRQLPAGVPGAFRLFANLLALGQGGGTR
jgi:LmbE family N-acetylglucosaminyl deacetylase